MSDSFGASARVASTLARGGAWFSLWMVLFSAGCAGTGRDDEGMPASDASLVAQDDASSVGRTDAGGLADDGGNQRADAALDSYCGSAPCALGQVCDRSILTPHCLGSCAGVRCAPGLVCQVEAEVGHCVVSCTPPCGAGQHCAQLGENVPTCVDNTCDGLACGALQACVTSADGRGFECVDNRCNGDLDCVEAQHCQAGVCQADVCQAGDSSCQGQTVRACMPNGAGLIDQVVCASAADLVSTCLSDAAGAACTCRDDWDCPAHTDCVQGRCVGTGRASTCFLPPTAFSLLLPRPEPGFPWGGNDLDGYDSSRDLVHGTPRSRDAAGHPFARHAQASTVPVVANLDDDNGDGRIDELDLPEIVFTTFCDQNYFNHGVLRAVHGGGAKAGKDLFAVCESKLWREGDPLLDGQGEPVDGATCDCMRGDLEPTGAVAVGDLDGEDGVPEIVVLAHTASAGAGDVPNHRVVIFRNTGELISDNEIGNIIGANPAVTIANVDGKGYAELIVGPTLLILSRNNMGHLVITRTLRGTEARGLNNGQGPVSCAADLTGDGVMEIVAGGTAYHVPTFPGSCPDDLASANADTRAYCQNQLPALWDADIDGFCAIADVLGAAPAAGMPELPPGFDQPLDGRPEVALISNGHLRIYDGATCGFDGVHCVARVDVVLAPRDGGPPNVDDFDGDGYPEIGTAFETDYAVHDLQLPTSACPAWSSTLDGVPASSDPHGAAAGNVARMPPALGCVSAPDCGDVAQFSCSKQGQCVCLHNSWHSATQDASSRVTGSSVFDFNGDGAAEVVYNDECYFRIYDGKDGHVYQRIDSQSPTRIEYPVVADVDSDGNAEIVFSGSNARSENCVHHDSQTFVNGIQVMGDPTDRWVSARRIWNEHAYHVTNVLESGAVPLREVSSWKTYGGRVYDSYRSNPPPLSNVAPDLAIAGLQVSSPDVRCGDALSRDLRIVALIVNQGDLRVGAEVPVRFLDDRGRTLGQSTLGVPLPPGGETFVSFSYRASSVQALPRSIRAVVDVGDSVRECIESNNQRDADVAPATAVAELRVSATNNSRSCPTRSLMVQVFNDAAEPVPTVNVGFYAGNPATGAKLLKTVTLTQVRQSSATPPLSVPLDIGALDVTVYVVVDPDNAVVECNDGNNTAQVDVQCQPPPF